MSKNKETICVHNRRDDQGVNTPIFPSTSNKYIGYPENVYPRYFNTVNQNVIVETLSKLEGAETGLIFSSGMAAIATALFTILRSKDHVLLSGEIYGGTYKLVVEEFEKFGIEYDFIAGSSADKFESKIKANTKAIYTETPSNPLLSIVDLNQIATLAKKHGLLTVVDNTFATPINQNPIAHGIDIVIHSGTKYLGGHSDLCFGALLTRKALKEKIVQSALNLGGSLNALDCYLIERSIKTLGVRVERHNTNALKVAEALNTHPEIARVFYPGLKTHPDHEIAATQMKNGFGGMLSFELNDHNLTDAFLNHLDLVTPSLSLGGVETTVCQPSRTSHAKVAEAERLKLGITNGLLRLSVGIENADDIINDMQMAMERAKLKS